MSEEAKKSGVVADQSMGAAMSKAGIANAEDTALLSETDIKKINVEVKANLPKLDPVKDFYPVMGMGKTKFMPSPECWAKIRLIFGISITEGSRDVLDYDGNNYYSYQAKGYRMVGGEKVYGIGTKTINFAAKQAEKEIAAQVKFEKKYVKTKAEADGWCQKEIIRIKNFGMEMCETGAINRLTRALTGFSSGIENDTEKKMLVAEATDVAQIAGGAKMIPEDKSKALATLFFAAGDLGIKEGSEVKKMMRWKLKVDSLTSISAAIIRKETKVLAQTIKDYLKYIAAGGGNNG